MLGVADQWVLLTYRLPREPSTPRIALWRKLRRLGALQLIDGLVALPLDARNREQLEWLADDVLEADGEATVWIAQPGSAAERSSLQRRMSAAAAAEYSELIALAKAAGALESQARRRELVKLRRELHRVRRRDYFPPPEREHAEQALAALAVTLDEEAVAR